MPKRLSFKLSIIYVINTVVATFEKKLIFFGKNDFNVLNLWWPREYFFWQVDVKSVIWLNNLPYFVKVQNLTYFQIFDLGWPLVTLRSRFLKSWRQERHFDIQFTHFQWTSKFDPKWSEICNLTQNEKFFYIEIIFWHHWSFWKFS